MTEQDKPQFLQCLNRLAVAFRTRDTVDATLMQVYFETLADWSITAVEDAGAELQRSGGSFFPTTAAWYEEAERFAAREQQRHRPEPQWRLPPSPEAQARLDAAHAEMLQKFEEVRAKFLARGIPPSKPSGLIHEFRRRRYGVCSECGATSRDLLHQPTCSRGVQGPAEAQG